MDNIFRIKLVLNGNEIEIEGPEDFVNKMLEKYENKILKPATAGSQKESKSKITPEISTVESKAISVGEFIRKTNFKKHTDIVLAFGYYLEEFMSTRQFTPADINNCYYEAKMESSNTSQMLIQLIRRSHIMLAKQEGSKKNSKKFYTLTQTGIDYVSNALKEDSE